MPVKRKTLKSNLADVENPEWTKDDFARTVPHTGGKRVSMNQFRKAIAKVLGRPRLDKPKEQVTLRLDADVVMHFRRGGRGWQTRINETLRRAAKLSAPARKVAAMKRVEAVSASLKSSRRAPSARSRRKVK
jgi:uncharacterized protein (DUF4415 family)